MEKILEYYEDDEFNLSNKEPVFTDILHLPCKGELLKKVNE